MRGGKTSGVTGYQGRIGRGKTRLGYVPGRGRGKQAYHPAPPEPAPSWMAKRRRERAARDLTGKQQAKPSRAVHDMPRVRW